MPLKVFYDGRSGYRFNWPERRLRMRTLYTTDKDEAAHRAQLLSGGMTAAEFKKKFAGTKKPAPQAQTDFASKMAEYRKEHPEEFGEQPKDHTKIVADQLRADEGTATTLDEVLRKVAEQRNGEVPHADNEYVASEESESAAPPIDDGNTEWDETTEKRARTNKRKYDKLATNIAHGLTQINLVMNGLFARAVRSDKRNRYSPQMPPEEITEITREGYSMQLEEWLDDTPPRPWMLILAGNIACVSFMLMHGEKQSKDGTPANPIPVGRDTPGV